MIRALLVLAHSRTGNRGSQRFCGRNGPVVATYEGNSAAYSNDLYLSLNAAGQPGDDGDLANDLFIFNNHSSPVGSTMDLGSFAVGTELMFRLHVNNTGNDFFSGAASRNPDNHTHARIQADWQPGTTLLSFEDLFNGPFFYNDLSFSFTNTSSTPSGVPEPATVGFVPVGFAGLAFRRWIHQK